LIGRGGRAWSNAPASGVGAIAATWVQETFGKRSGFQLFEQIPPPAYTNLIKMVKI